MQGNMTYQASAEPAQIRQRYGRPGASSSRAPASWSRGQLPGGGLPPAAAGAVAAGPSVALNFEGADLRDVVRNILTDILNESYTIDPQVGGTVTIRTTAGIPREALPATLEMLLRMNGAAMVKDAGIWKILPAAAAVRGNVTPQLGNSDARAAAGLQRADRSAALHERAADGVRARAVRERSDVGARRRPAQSAHPVGYRARAAPPLRDDRHVRRQLDGGHVGRPVHAAKRRRQDA